MTSASSSRTMTASGGSSPMATSGTSWRPTSRRCGAELPEGFEVPPSLSLAQQDLDELGVHYSLPVGEPMLLLRASHPQATAMLRACQEVLEEDQDGPDPDLHEALGRAITRTRLWQESH
jgi:hypothetical protein